jgi:biotin carboxylase
VRKAVASILETRANLMGQPLLSLALIEEYTDGPEYSIEIIAHQGSIRVVAVCEKIVGPPPFFVEVGHAVPASLGASLRDQMWAVAEAAVKALDIRTLVVHMEVRVRGGRVHVIETNFRPAGGRMATLISAVTGWNLNRVAVLLAIGEPPGDPGEPAAGAGVYQCLTVTVPSTVHYVKAPIRVNARYKPFVELDLGPGTVAYPVNDPRGRVIGRILAYGESIPQAWSEARRIRSALKFRTEPVEECFDESGPRSGCWEAGCC